MKRLILQSWLCAVAFLMSAVPALNAQLQSKEVTPTAVIGDSVLEVTQASPGEICDGYLFWHQADEIATDVKNYAMLLDAEGKLVHRWDNKLSGGGHTSYLLESGGLLRMGIRDQSFVRGQPVAAVDTLQITDRTGRPIWELDAKRLSARDSKITFHHDLFPMPNGNILVLLYEEFTAEKAAAIGWTAKEGGKVWSDGVMEINPNLTDGSYEVVWQWRFADHIIQDLDQNAANYGVVAEHPERIDCHFPVSYAPTNMVRQHLNAIDYHTELDQILISSFVYNEIWVIDHSVTSEQARGSEGGRFGKGGDLLFRYGNPAAYDAGTEEDRVFLKQHDANWIDVGLPGAGNILVMNNNTQLKPGSMLTRNRPLGAAAALAQGQLKGTSNVHEIRPFMDQESNYVIGEEGAFLVENIWFWEDPSFFAPFQGGARRLPNGNTLLSNTVRRSVLEVNPAGKIVARYLGPAPTFKSFKFSRERAADLLGK